MALTNQQLADKLDDVATGFQTFVTQVRAWATTPANGGPNNDGLVLLSDAVVTDYLPSLKKLQEEMLRGHDATNDVAFDFSGGVIGQNELLATYVHAGISTSFDLANSVGGCDAGLTSAATLPLKKNGSAWGTVTFNTNGTVTFTIAVPSIAHGDRVQVFGPATFIASFLNPAFTLAGSIAP